VPSASRLHKRSHTFSGAPGGLPFAIGVSLLRVSHTISPPRSVYFRCGSRCNRTGRWSLRSSEMWHQEGPRLAPRAAKPWSYKRNQRRGAERGRQSQPRLAICRAHVVLPSPIGLDHSCVHHLILANLKMMSIQNVKMGALILAWLAATVTTVVLNKHIFQIMDWKYPISLTIVHMVICVIGSFITLKVLRAVPFTVINSTEYISGVIPLGYASTWTVLPFARIGKPFAARCAAHGAHSPFRRLRSPSARALQPILCALSLLCSPLTSPLPLPYHRPVPSRVCPGISRFDFAPFRSCSCVSFWLGVPPSSCSVLYFV